MTTFRDYFIGLLVVFFVATPIIASGNPPVRGLGKKMLGSTKSGGAGSISKIASEIQTAKESFQVATIAFTSAKQNLINMVGNKEAAAKLEDKLEQAKKIEDPKEKDAAIRDVQKATDEEYEQGVTDEKIELSELSEDQKKTLVKVAKNLMLATLKDTETLTRVQKLTEDAPASLDAAKSDKMQATKEVTNIKFVSSAITDDLPQMAQDLPLQIKSLGSCAAKVGKLAKKNEVELPQAESVKVEDSFEG